MDIDIVTDVVLWVHFSRVPPIQYIHHLAVICFHLRHFVYLSAVEVMRRRWDILRLANRKRFRAFPGLSLVRKGWIQTITDDRNDKMSDVISSIKRTFQQPAMNIQGNI